MRYWFGARGRVDRMLAAIPMHRARPRYPDHPTGTTWRRCARSSSKIARERRCSHLFGVSDSAPERTHTCKRDNPRRMLSKLQCSVNCSVDWKPCTGIPMLRRSLRSERNGDEAAARGETRLPNSLDHFRLVYVAGAGQWLSPRVSLGRIADIFGLGPPNRRWHSLIPGWISPCWHEAILVRGLADRKR